MVEQAKEEIAALQLRRDELEARIDAGDLSGRDLSDAREQLDDIERQIAAVAAANTVPVLRELMAENQDAGPTEEVVGGIPVVTDENGETTIPISADGDARMNIGTSNIPFIDAALQKWRHSPELMLYKLQTNFYKFSWLLIPLSIPFVWLLFAWKRRFKAYDHAIFVTYSLSFMTLLILSVTLLGLAGAPEVLIVFASLLIPPIHIYKHLRGAYGLSRFSAFWRLAVLTIFILVVLMIFLQLLLVLGAF